MIDIDVEKKRNQEESVKKNMKVDSKEVKPAPEFHFKYNDIYHL